MGISGPMSFLGGGVVISGARSLLVGGGWVCPGDDLSRESVCLGACPAGGLVQRGGWVCPRSGYVLGRWVCPRGGYPPLNIGPQRWIPTTLWTWDLGYNGLRSASGVLSVFSFQSRLTFGGGGGGKNPKSVVPSLNYITNNCKPNDR